MLGVAGRVAQPVDERAQALRAVVGDGHDAPAGDAAGVVDDQLDDLGARADDRARAVVELDVDELAGAVGDGRAQRETALRDVEHARPRRRRPVAGAARGGGEPAGDARQPALLAEQAAIVAASERDPRLPRRDLEALADDGT